LFTIEREQTVASLGHRAFGIKLTVLYNLQWSSAIRPPTYMIYKKYS